MSPKDDAHNSRHDQAIRDRAIGLFTFLADFSRLRVKPVRSLESYEKVIWINDIPRESECWCAAWSRETASDISDESWVVIKKPRFLNPPLMPAVLEGWVSYVSVSDSSLAAPPLATHRVIEGSGAGAEPNAGTETVVESIEEHSDVKEAWSTYVEEMWLPWAENDRRLRRVQGVYAELFSMYQRQQRLGEQFEIILGQGLLRWNPEGSVDVKRHILTSKAVLEFDSKTGRLAVSAAAEGAATCLETDMLDPHCLPHASQQLAIEQQAAQITESVWDSTQVDSVLKGWAHSLSAEGSFDSSLDPRMDVSSKPLVRLAPAIVLRARGERSFLKFFGEVLKKLKEGERIPFGLIKFLTPAGESAARTAETDSGDVAALDDALELLFPLPANDAQRRIASRLEAQQGVVVQGPPGTGKSHSIVNLICHLLASGKRVLVTSHTARALQVLRKFLKTKVEAVSPLAVLLLGNDRDAMESMEYSVQGITVRFNSRDKDASQRKVREIEVALQQSRTEESRIRQEIKQVRERDIYRHPRVFSLYEGTLEHIAQQVRRDRDLYDWLPDTPAENNEPVFSPQDCEDLLRLLRHSQEIRSTAKPELEGIEPRSLPRPEDLRTLFDAEADANSEYGRRAHHREYREYPKIVSLSADQLRELIRDLSDLIKDCNALSSQGCEWVTKGVVDVLADHDRPWRELLKTSKELTDRLSMNTGAADRTLVRGAEGRDVDVMKVHAAKLLTHLRQGGRIGFGILRPSVVKQAGYMVDGIYVDGAVCRTADRVIALVRWIDVRLDLAALERIWKPYASVTSNTFAGKRAEFEDLCEALDGILAIHPKLTSLKKKVKEAGSIGDPVWHDQKDLKSLLDALEAADNAKRLAELRLQIVEAAKPIAAVIRRGCSLDLLTILHESITLRDQHAYALGVRELEEAYAAREDLRRLQLLQSRVVESLPLLAQQLLGDPQNPKWDSRLARLYDAWNWRRTNAWVQKMSDGTLLEKLSASLDATRSAIQGHLQELAAAKSWDWCFDRMTPDQAEHLVAWSKAVKNIGKGTGKQAGRHRLAAQEHMGRCRGAIPAWIMPLYRVAETVRPEPDIFDVAIIDEASQSGPEALLLLYLAKKIVVVGDDKQISPEFVGVNREDVNLIRERHLRDVPHSYFFGVDGSFFDLAEIRYQGRIRLREHFRCMPEIIQFSNNLSYPNEPLIPLKQYGSGRLRPVVQAVHVPDGFRSGHTSSPINAPEAEAIVRKVRELCDDPAYQGKTIGIISMQGDRQAQHIESLLMDKVGLDAFSNHEIVCGDAYAFQGDERDIIILSLVAAPDPMHRIGTLTGTKAEQRFNVAASRAREQMILFHTATATDLSSLCLRSKLLEYCQNPKVETLSIGDLSVEKLRQTAKQVDRSFVKAPKPFDSWFEVDVFLDLTGRGYRVIPQFEVAGFFIDLVVDGISGRLAVECDGDEWHGPEQYESDKARERVLERCGWTIERVRGSAYYLDPEKALNDLVSKLERFGIFGSAVEPARASEIPLPPKQTPRIKDEAPFDNAVRDKQPHQVVATAQVISLTDWVGRETVLESASGGVNPVNPSGGGAQTALQPSPAAVPDPAVKNPSLTIFQTDYETWVPVVIPDPRECPTAEILQQVVNVVGVEGPVMAGRVIQLLAHAAGIQRVREGAKVPIEKAIRLGLRRGLILDRNELHSREFEDRVLRIPGSPSFRLRTPGTRSFDEVPPSEIAALMHAMSETSAGLSRQDLFREILAQYGMRRLGHDLEDRLMSIWRRLEELLLTDDAT